MDEKWPLSKEVRFWPNLGVCRWATRLSRPRPRGSLLVEDDARTALLIGEMLRCDVEPTAWWSRTPERLSRRDAGAARRTRPRACCSTCRRRIDHDRRGRAAPHGRAGRADRRARRRADEERAAARDPEPAPRTTWSSPSCTRRCCGRALRYAIERKRTRGAARAPGAARPAHRPAQPGPVPRPPRRRARPLAPQRTRRSRCCSSTSTASRRSTTRSDTPPATGCSPGSPTACRRCCGRWTRSRGSAATSSRSCSRTSTSEREVVLIAERISRAASLPIRARGGRDDRSPSASASRSSATRRSRRERDPRGRRGHVPRQGARPRRATSCSTRPRASARSSGSSSRAALRQAVERSRAAGPLPAEVSLDGEPAGSRASRRSCAGSTPSAG